MESQHGLGREGPCRSPRCSPAASAPRCSEPRRPGGGRPQPPGDPSQPLPALTVKNSFPTSTLDLPSRSFKPFPLILSPRRYAELRAADASRSFLQVCAAGLRAATRGHFFSPHHLHRGHSAGHPAASAAAAGRRRAALRPEETLQRVRAHQLSAAAGPGRRSQLLPFFTSGGARGKVGSAPPCCCACCTALCTARSVCTALRAVLPFFLMHAARG